MAFTAALSIQRSKYKFYLSSDKFVKIHFDPSYIAHLDGLATSIQAFHLEETGPEGRNLEKEIRDALWRAEDIIESYMLTHLLSPEDVNESSGDMSQRNLFEDIKKVMQEIESIKERLDKFFANDLHQENSDRVVVSVEDLPPVHKNKMVGLDEELENMKKVLLESKQQSDRLELVISGMGGIGKTSLAISIYNDLDVRSHFSIGAWVKISLQHSVRNILLCLVHTMEFFNDKRKMKEILNSITIDEMDDEELANFVREKLMVERYLVIVDCLCEINHSSWDYITTMLPDSNNASRILLVNRLRLNSNGYQKQFLDRIESWNLLQQQVFGDEPCPKRELEKTGKRIAEKCQGLPLAIITVGAHLAKKEKTVEYWNKVAESGNSIAYAADGEPMFEQLGLSYKQMPRRLRPIFLYMATFPESQTISTLKLQILWGAEVLTDLKEFGTVENLDSEPFEYYFYRDLIISDWKDNIEMSTYSLHHAVWHFCCNQAAKEDFFHVFDEYAKHAVESNVDNKVRRMVIRNTLLFGIFEFVRKIKHSALSIRSMLFTGPYHSYPLTRITWGDYKMLRVLNACSIRLYEFPVEILYLKLLIYLELTLSSANIPPGISKLSNLTSLIVRVHHIVMSCEGSPTYLPIEIWEMRQLTYLQVIGCDLPVPPHSDTLLPNLETILDVSPHSCTKEILERIPKLKLLKISINLSPKRNTTPIWLFDHGIQLANLESANFMINNPYFEVNNEPQVLIMPENFSFSMKNIEHLSLSGCGFPWESIEPISHLPLLEMLELRSHAFRGPKWEITSTGFRLLTYLRLEDLDLVHWTTTSEDQFLPCLKHVIIIRCHKLEQIPVTFVHYQGNVIVQILDSSLAAESWSRSAQKERFQTHKMGLTITSERQKYVTPRFEFRPRPL